MTPKFVRRYEESKCHRTLYDKTTTLNPATELIVIIPAYKEVYDELLKTLESIETNDISFHVAVFILINYKEADKQLIKNDAQVLYQKLEQYSFDNDKLELRTFVEELSGKKSGVGLARKMLMDGAFLQFCDWSRNGIIVNLDADTTVDKHYLTSIKAYFLQNKSIQAASIAFHHLANQDLIVNENEASAITNYELHLRYFINMQRWVGLPYAYQTIGSAMAVRSYAYAKEGGMNVRQAGEDFYFLQKYATNWELGEINETVVYPSARSSDRVPFGTGKAVASFEIERKTSIKSYHPLSFIALKQWIRKIEPWLYSKSHESAPLPVDTTLAAYLKETQFETAIDAILENTKPGLTRIKKFYNWFDAFKLFKYLHYARDNSRPNLPIENCLEGMYKLIAQLGYLAEESEGELYFSLKKILEYDLAADYNNQWRAALISRLSKT